MKRTERLRASRGRNSPDRATLEGDRPDRDVGFKLGGPGLRGWRKRLHAVQGARDDRHLGSFPLIVRKHASWNVAIPQHGEVRIDELVLRGKIQPDLKEL